LGRVKRRERVVLARRELKVAAVTERFGEGRVEWRFRLNGVSPMVVRLGACWC
jgi:hypothetical protein